MLIKGALILLLLVWHCSFSESYQDKEVLYKAKMLNSIVILEKGLHSWNSDTLRLAANQFNKIAGQFDLRYHPLYWRGVAEFHVASQYLFPYKGKPDKNSASKWISPAIETFKLLTDNWSDKAEPFALLATLYGQSIYINPITAVIYGSKIELLRKKALQLDSLNPRIYYLTGMGYYHTPEVMGGGVKKALPFFLKAEKLFIIENEKKVQPESTPFQPHWGRALNCGFVGRSYHKSGDFKKAQYWLKKTLEMNPEDSVAIRLLDEMN
jgi:tetratricopeptide (TPR) repeat protein